MTVWYGRRVSAKKSKEWSHLRDRNVGVRHGLPRRPLGSHASGRTEDASRDALRGVCLAPRETTSRAGEVGRPTSMQGRAITTSIQSRGIRGVTQRVMTTVAPTAVAPTRLLGRGTKVALRPTARRGGAI